MCSSFTQVTKKPKTTINKQTKPTWQEIRPTRVPQLKAFNQGKIQSQFIALLLAGVYQRGI